MIRVCSAIGLCLLATACLRAEAGTAACPIALTLSAPATRAKNIAPVVFIAKYTNVGSNTIAVYDFLRIRNGPLPAQQGLWYRWTRLLVATGKEFRECVAEPDVLIKALPEAEPITLAPGQSYEFSMPLSKFHLDLGGRPRRVQVCARYAVESASVARHQLVWVGTLNSNVITLELESQR